MRRSVGCEFFATDGKRLPNARGYFARPMVLHRIPDHVCVIRLNMLCTEFTIVNWYSRAWLLHITMVATHVAGQIPSLIGTVSSG